MYGLLLQAIYDYVKTNISEDAWAEIIASSGTHNSSFITHACYDEDILPQIAEAAARVTGVNVDELMENFATHFVTFISNFGYDKILKVLGRTMRDFLNGLDNLHEYMRLSYPKMQAPSFFCDNETRNSLMLHYRSRRKGFIHYVIGQIRQIGLVFYDTQVEIEIVKVEEINKISHVVMKLHFDNKGYNLDQLKRKAVDAPMMKSEVFFRSFPFHIVFGRDMVIRHIGKGLEAMFPELVKRRLDHEFELNKPPIDFTYENVTAYNNNVFQLFSVAEVKRRRKHPIKGETRLAQAPNFNDGGVQTDSADEDFDDNYFHVRLKGQMRFVPAWDAYIYLANPILDTLEQMYHVGLCINDLNMHDASRDMVLLGTVHSKELRVALKQARQKSRKLEEIVRLLDLEIRRSDTLLYQMIPKQVADRLRYGTDSAMDTCQVMEAITILFSEVIDFNAICSKITPMDVVGILNNMYTRFDTLTEVHKVYKVETVGDAYMVVSGAPIPNRLHALVMCDMALDMIDAIQSVPNPATEDEHILIKLGIHSGTVVAGVVGLKMPRYCLFGDTVNTASRMESNGMPMKIHISEKTKNCLRGFPYTVEERSGLVHLKGKGQTKTYWLTERKGPSCTQLCDQSPITQPNSPIRNSSRRRSSVIDMNYPLDEEFTQDRPISRCMYTPVQLEPRRNSMLSIYSGHHPGDNSTRNGDVPGAKPKIAGDGSLTGAKCSTKVCVIF